MYSSLQQACLVELGIVPLSLRSEQEKLANPTPVQINEPTPQPHHVGEAVSSKFAKPKKKLSDLLKQPVSAVVQTQQITESSPANINNEHNISWHDTPISFVDDLAVLFPELQIDAHTLQLTQNLSWQLNSKIATYQIFESRLISNNPNSLSHEDLKSIWQFICQFVPAEKS